MEQSKERNHVCKFCNKRFPCGKSLGGHIRTHMKESFVDSEEEKTCKLRIGDNGGESSYGLKENPKKNKRLRDQREIVALKHQLLCCRECGKGFTSLKALCGHMACHSEKEKMVMDSQSDTETSSAPLRRRSKRVMKHHQKTDLVFVGGNMNQSNSASSASGIEQEQEELALCLMMLSRDHSLKESNKLVYSLAESSDNNSVILETKSSSGDQLKIFNVNNTHEISKVDDQLRSADDNGVVLYDSDNSDSGYFRNGPKKLDSDISVDCSLKNTGFNKTSMESGSRFNNLKRFKNTDDLGKEWFKERGSGRSCTKYELRKSKRVLFPSSGGKKIKNEFTESVHENGEHSLETDSCEDTNLQIHKSSSSSKAPVVTTPICKKSGGTKKKSKGHECPICFRMFKSGQALGGHKRSHFIGNQEHKTMMIQHQVAEMHTLLDLNLPAPVDE